MNGSSANSWRTCLQARNGLGRQKQTSESSRILQRFVWYTGAGLLVSSIAALAVRLWLPESSHMPLFILVHSLCIGVALMLLIRSVDTARTDPALHKISRTNQTHGDRDCVRQDCSPLDHAGVRRVELSDQCGTEPSNRAAIRPARLIDACSPPGPGRWQYRPEP